MKKKIIKYTLSGLVVPCLFTSITSATTTERGWKIYEQLKEDGRTNGEIRFVLDDLGYNADEYMGNSSYNRGNSSSSTTQLGREILDKLRREGWTDNEIKEKIEDLGYDASAYFPSSNSNSSYTSPSYSSPSYSYDSSTYVSRSCKTYSIEYISSLNAYTSPNLKRREYFINTDYFKRYIDSKNIFNVECAKNSTQLSSYNDTSSNTNRFIAPNGKIYFITQQDGYYTSNELNSAKRFGSIDELRRYIGRNNPLANI